MLDLAIESLRQNPHTPKLLALLGIIIFYVLARRVSRHNFKNIGVLLVSGTLYLVSIAIVAGCTVFLFAQARQVDWHYILQSTDGVRASIQSVSQAGNDFISGLFYSSTEYFVVIYLLVFWTTVLRLNVFQPDKSTQHVLIDSVLLGLLVVVTTSSLSLIIGLGLFAVVVFAALLAVAAVRLIFGYAKD